MEETPDTLYLVRRGKELIPVNAKPSDGSTFETFVSDGINTAEEKRIDFMIRNEKRPRSRWESLESIEKFNSNKSPEM